MATYDDEIEEASRGNMGIRNISNFIISSVNWTKSNKEIVVGIRCHA